MRIRLQQNWFQLRDFAITARYEGLSYAMSHPAPPGPRFIRCNSAWADRTFGFPKVAEALYVSLCNGFKRIYIAWFEILSGLTVWGMFCPYIAMHSVHCHPFFCSSWCHSLRLFLQTTSLPRWVIHWVHVWGKKNRKSSRRGVIAALGNGDPELKGSGF